ncbi:hypothetical protein ACVC7V_20090 [Hydrogenophaga sp. A37]|uniref:hypothetical protein n=1 Tax=Hydrogenophaga sp. A37 TaxID=1945864 RepID=UPI00117AD70C|nr:hypothetical protein [Hydrogenophaga sp. A37]
MRYIAGVAFVASLFQGNFELAMFIAGCFGVVYLVLSVYSSFSDKSKLSDLTLALLNERVGWKVLRFKDDHSKSVGDLIYSPDSRAAILVKKCRLALIILRLMQET